MLAKILKFSYAHFRHIPKNFAAYFCRKSYTFSAGMEDLCLHQEIIKKLVEFLAEIPGGDRA